jgi:hypothetical protein
MNVLLYILFIVICVVFQFTEDNSASACPGREQLKSNDHAQFVISVIYATFISALSLGIALSFAIFGSRIVQSFGKANNNVLKRTARKVFSFTTFPFFY